ncbi:MAG: SPFH domain-containing protein [Propionibacteriaceae bacterium]|nr:SPFH domain-containing protein [Propionibacteriaceae bacterium]
MFDFIFENPITGVVGIVIVIALLIWMIASRYRVAKPNEAFVITGPGGGGNRKAIEAGTGTSAAGQRVVRGGGAFIVPLIQQLSVIDLSSHRIEVSVDGAYNQKGIKLNAKGVAIVKVGGTDEAIRAAAQRFVAQQTSVEYFTKEVLTGSLRSIIGSMDVDKIVSDRAEFAKQVAETSESSLSGQGLIIDTFQIQEIQDAEDGTYLRDLGRPEQAFIRQRAEIAEADSRKAAEQAKAQADQAIAEAQRDLSLKRAEIQSVTDKASAQAANSGPLEQANQQRMLVTEQQKVAEQDALLREKQLAAEVRKPADARRYQIETEAAAQQQATILAAEAEKSRRLALADAMRAEGEAQAAAAKAKGSAEAEVLDKKAAAYRNYNDAAVLEMAFRALPEMAKEIATPMAAIDNLTVVSTDGASDLSKKVARTTAEVPALLKDLSGIDLVELIKSYTTGRTQQQTLPVPQAAGQKAAAIDEE